MNINLASWFAPYCYPARYKSLSGGRGSGKSHQIARLAILRMMLAFSDPARIGTNLPYYPPVPVRILSGRQFNVTLANSVKTVMADFIDEARLGDDFYIGNYKIVHRATQSSCFFQGIDRNINNIRSTEGIDIWWFEEAQFLTKEQMDIILPTVRKWTTCPITGRRYPPEVWCVWNPLDRSSWTWQRFFEHPVKGDMHRHINYYDNPWLPENILELAEYDKEHYPTSYEHVWLGHPQDGDANEQVLPYQMVRTCVNAWHKRPTENKLRQSNCRTDLGVDIAVGGNDKCAAALRTGPVVHDIKLWNGTLDTDETARTSVEFMSDRCGKLGLEPWSIYYDASTPMESAFRNSETPTPYYAVNFGSRPGGADRPWEGDVLNGDHFGRRNIQLATAVRQRAHRTMRYMNGDKTVDPLDCLFINPNINGLDRMISLMSQPTRFQANTGKWEIDKRGGGNKNVKSPDEFDALILAFTDDSEYGLRSERLY